MNEQVVEVDRSHLRADIAMLRSMGKTFKEIAEDLNKRNLRTPGEGLPFTKATAHHYLYPAASKRKKKRKNTKKAKPKQIAPAPKEQKASKEPEEARVVSPFQLVQDIYCCRALSLEKRRALIDILLSQ